MTARAVHWHDGMFLRPHHLQAAQRYDSLRAHRSDRWNVHFAWGLRSVRIDPDALANFRFVINRLEARLRDGTPIVLPEDGAMPSLDLKSALEFESAATIFLAVPQLALGKANSGDNTGEGSRFLVDVQEFEDENTGVNPQPIQVRLLNVKLLVGNEDQTGFEVLPIARVERSQKAEALPQLDFNYIPPLLACDAWEPLHQGILQSLFDRIGKKIELLAAQVQTRGINFDSDGQGDQLILEQLRALNEAYALLGSQAFAPGVHPFGTYVELCRLVGQLAIFGPSRRTPELPRYDHDDLGFCYFKVKQQLDALLDAFLEPGYKERPFVGAGFRMQVALEPNWLEGAELFIGVQSPLPSDEVIKMLTVAGQLDMKVGSSDRVDSLYRLGQAGLRFEPTPLPPRALPVRNNLLYFQINRSAQQTEWQNVQRSLALAIRLNENRIVGDIQGQRVLTIKHGSQTTTLQFTLFVLPTGAG